jgi:hypothetical protein
MKRPWAASGWLRRRLVRGNRPAHGLGDLLAGRAQREALRVPTGHPHLAAEGLYRRGVDDPLYDGRTRGHVVTVVGLHALKDDMGHPFMVTVEGRIGLDRGNGGGFEHSFRLPGHPVQRIDASARSRRGPGHDDAGKPISVARISQLDPHDRPTAAPTDDPGCGPARTGTNSR